MPVEPEQVEVPAAADGRRARRQRGQAAVIDAFFALLAEGHLPPTTDAIIERSGVSLSSVFRYFDSIEDLQRQAIDTHFAHHAALFHLPDQHDAPTRERIQGLVSARLLLYDTTAPVARLARARAPENEVIRATLHEVRARLSDQVAAHLAPELAPLPPAGADDLVAVVAALTSFETWDLLIDAGRTRRQIQRAWIAALRALLTPT